MRLLTPLAVAVALMLTGLSSAAGSGSCKPPKGHKIGDCRFGVHGTPDLSRAQWHSRRGAEVTISDQIRSLAPNAAAGSGAASWPLIDSLGQPMGTLTFDAKTRHFSVLGLSGQEFKADSVRIRGRGCAASTTQQKRFALVQIHAGDSASHGTQAFLATAALDKTSPTGVKALADFRAQHGTGCGPSGKTTGKLQSLRNPNVGATAHARLSNGVINSVDEYDVKPDFGDVVYFMTNTTSVAVGGIARGMLRVGTPITQVDRFTGCDPNSGGTLTWRYWAITTGDASRPKIYGWIPARCHAGPSR